MSFDCHCCNHCLLLHRWDDIVLDGQTVVDVPQWIGQLVSAANLQQHLNDNVGLSYKMTITPAVGWSGTLGIAFYDAVGTGGPFNGVRAASLLLVIDRDKLQWHILDRSGARWEPVYADTSQTEYIVPEAVDPVVFPLELTITMIPHRDVPFSSESTVANVYLNGTLAARFRNDFEPVREMEFIHLWPTADNTNPVQGSGPLVISNYEVWVNNREPCFFETNNVYWERDDFDLLASPNYSASGFADPLLAHSSSFNFRNYYNYQIARSSDTANGFLSGWSAVHTPPGSLSYQYAISEIGRRLNTRGGGTFGVGSVMYHDIQIQRRIANIFPPVVEALGTLTFLSNGVPVQHETDPTGGLSQAAAEPATADLLYVLDNVIGRDFTITQT